MPIPWGGRRTSHLDTAGDGGQVNDLNLISAHGLASAYPLTAQPASTGNRYLMIQALGAGSSYEAIVELLHTKLSEWNARYHADGSLLAGLPNFKRDVVYVTVVKEPQGQQDWQVVVYNCHLMDPEQVSAVFERRCREWFNFITFEIEHQYGGNTMLYYLRSGVMGQDLRTLGIEPPEWRPAFSRYQPTSH
ncbi:hypothetical protein IWQ60_007130 [Tieghemiomyces parasiticus]|uniref:Uncharacterized protein n=1 Tax=Tieghemiomyces parasiticus TaxID=78921 RepID=A0A9W7ZZI8_9FUNG|nr:hypothetical protein IWQ60_007130 [Tieghemiomyces parasiticus]